jgi:hypothetical protein
MVSMNEDWCARPLLWRASSWVTPSSLSRWRHTPMTHQLLIFSKEANRVLQSIIDDWQHGSKHHLEIT